MYAEDVETPAIDKSTIVEPTIEELAAQQGVLPVTDARSMLGKSDPDDERDEAFAEMLRGWRREGVTPATPSKP